MRRLIPALLLVLLLIPLPAAAQQSPPAPTCDFSEWLAFMDESMLPTMQESMEALQDNQTNPATLFRLYTELGFIRMSLENSDASITGCGEPPAALNNTAISLMSAWQDIIAFQIFGLYSPPLSEQAGELAAARVDRLAELMEEYNTLRDQVE
jgi:hypothetical protein